MSTGVAEARATLPRVDVVAYLRRTALWLPIIVIALLAMPMALTHHSFGHDWTLHLWLIRQQQLNIEAVGHPTLFLSAQQLGAFYPMFAFVGSGIYSLGGYLAIVLGDRPVLAYKLLYVGGLCMAYGGFTGLAIQRGLRGWRSQVPGLVFVTGAYYVTQMLGIGDLGEFMALSSIPLLIASVCALLGREQARTRDGLALVCAVFVLTGSNNITLLWGSAFLVLMSVVTLFAFGSTWPRPLPWRRALPLLACGAIGAGLNAWYLFPDVKYGLDTFIAHVNHTVPLTYLEHPGLLLNPIRTADQAHNPLARDIRVTLPWLFIGWALTVGIALWRGRDRAAHRWFVGLVVVGVGYFTFIVAKTPWHLLPHPFYNIQFTRRLHSYVLFATALLMLLVLEWQTTAAERLRRLSTTVLTLIVIATIATATAQVWRVHSQYHVVGPHPGVVSTDNNFNAVVVAAKTVVPPSWYTREDFRDSTAPKIETSAKRVLTVPVTAVRGTTFAGRLAVPDGPEPFRTNISSGPRFVTMTGIRAVGTTRRGLVVAVRAPGAPTTGPVDVTIREASTTVLNAGSAVSAASALAVLGMLAWPIVRRLRRTPTPSRRAPPS